MGKGIGSKEKANNHISSRKGRAFGKHGRGIDNEGGEDDIDKDEPHEIEKIDEIKR